MKPIFAIAFLKNVKLPLTAALIFEPPCQSLTPRGYRTRRWALEWSLLDTCLASSIGLSSRQFVSCLGAGEVGGGANGRGKGERRRGGQPWIRLLIASLGGLLLRARYSVLLCCRRQSDSRVTTQQVVNAWDFAHPGLEIRIGKREQLESEATRRACRVLQQFIFVLTFCLLLTGKQRDWHFLNGLFP